LEKLGHAIDVHDKEREGESWGFARLLPGVEIEMERLPGAHAVAAG
jgi:hypothetical protein